MSTLAPPPAAPPPPAPEGDGDADPGIRPADILRLVAKHALILVLCATIAPTVAYFYTARQAKVYESATSIVFDFPASALVGRKMEVFDPYADYMSKSQQIETEMAVIQSSRVIKQAVLDMGLHLDRTYCQKNYGTPTANADDVAADIRGRVRVEPSRTAYTAIIRVEDADPVMAQRIATGVVETYARMSAEDAVAASTAAIEWLGKQLQRLQNEVETTEMSLHDFKLKRNLLSVSLNDQNNMLKDEIDAFSKAVTAAAVKRAQLVARANALAKVTHTTPEDIPAAELLADPLLQGLRNKWLEARQELATLKIAGKETEHPDVKSAQSKQDHALAAYIAQVRNVQAAATREAAVVGNEASSLRGLLEQAKQRALDLNLQEIEYKKLNRSAASSQKLYDNVLDRMREVDLSRMVAARTVKVLDPAVVNGVPIRPKPGSNVAVALSLGVALGVLIAVVRELLDRRLKSPLDLEQRLRVTTLGVLPHTETASARKPKRARGPVQGAPELLVHDAPSSMMAEAARTVRSNLLFMRPDSPPKTILVTSAGPGEGKTTTACTLACVLAQTEAKTLIIDLDLRRPRIHRVFGVSSDKGVTTALMGKGLDEAIRATEVPHLDVLPAGPIPPNPSELLMSHKMEALLAELSARYDRIIIDSSPVNPVTDAVILSTRVDGVVMVGRAFQTTIDQLKLAVRTMRDVGAPILGGILNAVDLSRADYKYSSYYYYRADYSPRPDASG